MTLPPPLSGGPGGRRPRPQYSTIHLMSLRWIQYSTVTCYSHGLGLRAQPHAASGPVPKFLNGSIRVNRFHAVSVCAAPCSLIPRRKSPIRGSVRIAVVRVCGVSVCAAPCSQIPRRSRLSEALFRVCWRRIFAETNTWPAPHCPSPLAVEEECM